MQFLIPLSVHFSDARPVGRAPSATSASGIRAVCTDPARSPTTASAMKAGAGSSATRISTTAPTTGRARTAPPAETPARAPTRAAALRVTPEQTAKPGSAMSARTSPALMGERAR